MPSGRFSAAGVSRQEAEVADVAEVAEVAEPQSSRLPRLRPRLPQLPQLPQLPRLPQLPQLPSWLSLGRTQASPTVEPDEPAPGSTVTGRSPAGDSPVLSDRVGPMQAPSVATRQPPFDSLPGARRPRRPPPDPAPKPDQEAILASRRSDQDQPVANSAPSSAPSSAPDAARRDVVSQWVAKKSVSTPPVADPPVADLPVADPPVADPPERGLTVVPNQGADAESAAAPAAPARPRLEAWSDRSVPRAAETADAARPLPAMPRTSIPTRVAPSHMPDSVYPDGMHSADPSPRRIPRVSPAAERTTPELAPIVNAAADHDSPPQTAADRSPRPISTVANSPGEYPEGSWLATYERLVREVAADRPVPAPPAEGVRRSLRSRP